MLTHFFYLNKAEEVARELYTGNIPDIDKFPDFKDVLTHTLDIDKTKRYNIK